MNTPLELKIENRKYLGLFILFFFSGFAGLIYESIWTHYLKLFLGHAAYAQTLVLSIFMLGMALGSWIAGRITHYTKRFFLIYAVVELVLGIFAFSFNGLSQLVMAAFFDSIVPNYSNAMLINGIKWSIGAALIIPQSILIGMTFPLIANGLLILNRNASGRMISQLYFTNSIGASIGVIACGFLFIDRLGLPGSLNISGSINVLIAICILLLNKSIQATEGNSPGLTKSESVQRVSKTGGLERKVLLLMTVAAFTGLASFIYEITWIRLLSMVLGSATHSFELMLSAFILGLSLGGFFIRKVIDKLVNPLRVLSIIQIVMGVMAVVSLILYNYSFEFIQVAYLTLNKVSTGYYLYSFAGHLICLVIMLPATIFAGMTLPIIINILVRDEGDQAVGQVYAINTVGSIVGILLSVHFLLPEFGAKNTLIIGAAIDILLGLILLGLTKSYTSIRNFAAICLATCVLFIALFQAELNLHKLVSGVFRHGQIVYDREILFHKDGKTATVSLFSQKGEISLLTNGKPDASMRLDDERSGEEATQTLIGAIPVTVVPRQQHVAVIGFGSGMSTHAILTSDNVGSVDTIEIEPVIVEAAKAFYKKAYLAFDDPRSHIVFEDAKTFFAVADKEYDMIIAEPSNPWVSGVSSLFTTEFYGNTKRYLAEGGVFAQWVQTYELSTELFASLANAIGERFAYYEIYAMTGTNLLFIASDQPLQGSTKFDLLDSRLKRLLLAFDIRDELALEAHRLATKQQLGGLFKEFSTLVNSDYFPYVDQRAVKARFLRQWANGITSLKYGELPIEEPFWQQAPAPLMNPIAHLPHAGKRYDATMFYRRLILQEDVDFTSEDYAVFFLTDDSCDKAEEKLFWKMNSSLFSDLFVNLSSEQMREIWGYIQVHRCIAKSTRNDGSKQRSLVVDLLESRVEADFNKIQALCEQLIKYLASNPSENPVYTPVYLKKLWLWANLMADDTRTLPYPESELLYIDENKNWVARYLLMEYETRVNNE